MIDPLIDHLKKIESAAYPRYMQQMREVEGLEDVADYCDCDVDALVILKGATWYFLGADHGQEVECVDIAKIPGTDIDWNCVLDWIRHWSGSVAYGDCREHMISILRRVSGALGGHLILGERWEWGDEIMTKWTIDMRQTQLNEEKEK